MSNMSRCALFMNIITQNGFYKKHELDSTNIK